ncbi:unnamed protein product, partial [Urochloa humidicola]
SEAHGGVQIGPIAAYALSHKGKATSDVAFNPEDGPEAYSNPLVHTRLSQYSEMARQVHGSEWDPTTAEIDGDILMRVGGGKQHGRYAIAHSLVDTASTPTLSQLRARTTSSDPPIRPRQTSTQLQLDALQAKMEAEMDRRVQEALQAERERVQAERDAERQRLQAERDAKRQRVDAMVQYMQGLATSLGQAPLPPALFAPPPFVRDATPPPSAASNIPDMSPPQPLHWSQTPPPPDCQYAPLQPSPPGAQYPPLQPSPPGAQYPPLLPSSHPQQHSSPYPLPRYPYASPPYQQLPPRPPPSL